ncbi:MAG TPA: CoA transferase [Natronosporangium sp.]
MNLPARPGPLADIRVLELTQGIAGPTCGKYLAGHGAEVIRVESRRRPDVIRLYGSRAVPADTDPDLLLETAPHWSNYNAGKLSVGLDIADPRGRDLLLRLVEVSDVLITNFAVGVCERLGVGPADLAARNPALIYCALSSFGQRPGRYRTFRIWGPNLSAVTGLDSLTAGPGRPPCGLTWISYSDYLAGAHAAVAVLAALADPAGPRLLDISQAQVTLGAIGPELLLASLAEQPDQPGEPDEPAEPADDALRGVYPVRGEDRWLLIDCPDRPAVERLLAVAALDPDPDWADLERAIAGWTAEQDGTELCQRLAAAGVAAAPVNDQADWLTDPQLGHRRPWLVHPDPCFGTGVALGYPPRLRHRPARFARGGPVLGEDNDYVLGELLGLDQPARAELVAAGVVHPPVKLGEPFPRPGYPLARHLLRDPAWGRPAGPLPRPRPVRERTRPAATPVSELRVLDLTDRLGAPAAKLLADLGAQVIRVVVGETDPLLGDPGHPDLRRAAAHAYFTGSRPVRRCDAAQARRLAAGADLVLVSGPAPAVRATGLLELADAAGGPVVVAITPYGLTGPRADWPGGEATAWAAGGLAYVTGEPDQPPVVPDGHLVCALAGEFAAVAALAASRGRRPGDPGELVDISLQDTAVAITGEFDLCGLLDDGKLRHRAGARRTSTAPLGMYPAADGLVSIVTLMPSHWTALRDWIVEVTGDREVLDPALAGGPNRRSGPARERVDRAVERFTRRLPKQTLFLTGQGRSTPVTPVNQLTEVLADPDLCGPGFLVDYQVAGRTGRAPGRLFETQRS